MFRKLLNIALIAAAFGAATVASSTFAAELKEINFGIISTEATANLKADWEPILKDMERKTGYKINAFFAPDYAGVIEGMRFNKVQVAWMGNKSGIEAVDRASAEVFAQTTYADGSPGYWSLLITHKDSPYKTLEDVIKHGKEISFGLGDPNSTSGTVVPGYYVFALNNIDPKTHFKSARSSNHEGNLLAVLNKQVDVATNNTEVMGKFEDREPEKAKNLRVIWKSPLIPADPMMWRVDLPKETKEKVKAFFMTYAVGDTPEAIKEKANLAKLTFGAFKDSSNAQLNPIRQLELFKDKVKVENDDKLDAAAKQARLAEINKKLSELGTIQAAK